MKGKDEYEKRIMDKIEILLSKNGDYLRGYYNFIAMNKSLASAYQYCSYVAAFVNSVGKNVEDINMDDCSAYITKMYQTKSSSYTISTYSAMRLFGKYLKSRYKVDNPMEDIQRPKPRQTIESISKRENGYLEKREIKKVKQAISDGVGSGRAKYRQREYKNRDMLIIAIFLNTGIRCSALVKIDVDDINTEQKCLSVQDKGGKIKTYGLSYDVIELYKKWLIDRNVILDEKHEDALFISNQKRRISQKGVSDVVAKYTSNIEGKHITPHKLRATYGTQLYNATHDIYYVQQCMNHNSPKTTELYIRGSVKDTSGASEIMSKLF